MKTDEQPEAAEPEPVDVTPLPWWCAEQADLYPEPGTGAGPDQDSPPPTVPTGV